MKKESKIEPIELIGALVLGALLAVIVKSMLDKNKQTNKSYVPAILLGGLAGAGIYIFCKKMSKKDEEAKHPHSKRDMNAEWSAQDHYSASSYYGMSYHTDEVIYEIFPFNKQDVGKFVYVIFSPWYAGSVVLEKDAKTNLERYKIHPELILNEDLPHLEKMVLNDKARAIIGNYNIEGGAYPQITDFIKYRLESETKIAVNYGKNLRKTSLNRVIYFLAPQNGYYTTQRVEMQVIKSNDHNEVAIPEIFAHYLEDPKMLLDNFLSHFQLRFGVVALEISASAGVGFRTYEEKIKRLKTCLGKITGVNASAYAGGGVAFDKYNVAVYGNIGALASLTCIDYAGASHHERTTSKTINDLWNYFVGLGAGVNVGVNWCWRYDDLTQLFGASHDMTIGITKFSGGIIYNTNEEVCGISTSIAPISASATPIDFSSFASENKGIIMTYAEFYQIVNFINAECLTIPNLQYAVSNSYYKMTKKAFDVYETARNKK